MCEGFKLNLVAERTSSIRDSDAFADTNRCHTRTPMRAYGRLGLLERNCETVRRGRPHIWAHAYVRHSSFVGAHTCVYCLHASFQAVEYDNRFFVNPGSASGAWTGSFNGCVALCRYRLLSDGSLQRSDTFLCPNGYPRPRRGHLRVPADRRGSEGGEDRIPEGHGHCKRSAKEYAPEYSFQPPSATTGPGRLVTYCTSNVDRLTACFPDSFNIYLTRFNAGLTQYTGVSFYSYSYTYRQQELSDLRHIRIGV